MLTPDEILREIVEMPRRAFVPLPDLRVIERPGWLQLVTPSFRQGGFNEVAHAVLTHAEADAIIDRTIGEYRALGIQFRWMIDPDSAPADLAERLARRGLTRSVAHGMVRSTEPTGSLAGDDAPGVTVEDVDARTVAVYTDTMGAGWSTDPAPLLRAHELALAMPERTHRLFLARVDGVPAGTASYVAFPRSAYLLGGVVLPAYRRRGVYRALVAARLRDARQRGIELATCRAQEDTAAPRLERLGFATVCRFTSFRG